MGVNQNFIGASAPQGVAVDGLHVYWSDQLTLPGGGLNSGTVGRANLDGTSPDQSFIGNRGPPAVPGAVSPVGMAVDSAHVYWADSYRDPNTTQLVFVVVRANLDGTGVNDTFIDTQDALPQGVAVDGAHVYWSGANAIGRANLDGTGVNQSFITGASAPAGVAVDGGVATCAGRRATIVGSGRRDMLRGTRGDDVIAAGAGDDTVRGRGGDDRICGGAGKDVLRGGPGEDLLRGGSGKDALHGGAGADGLKGGRGRDLLRGGRGRDTLTGGGGDDRCRGGGGHNRRRHC